MFYTRLINVLGVYEIISVAYIKFHVQKLLTEGYTSDETIVQTFIVKVKHKFANKHGVINTFSGCAIYEGRVSGRLTERANYRV